MRCNLCEPERQLMFPAEVNVHFPGREDMTKPTVWVFPTLKVCMDCGLAQFVIPQEELSALSAISNS
jgi:hypothetical protein